jgi:hypothetical protein
MIVDPREIEIESSRPHRRHHLTRWAVRYRCRWRAPDGREMSCYLWVATLLLANARIDPLELIKRAAAARLQALIDAKHEAETPPED